MNPNLRDADKPIRANAEGICRNCDHEGDGGFFNSKICPKCNGWLGLSGRLRLKVIKIGIPPAVVFAGLSFLARPVFTAVVGRAVNVLDIRTFFAYGWEACAGGLPLIVFYPVLFGFIIAPVLIFSSLGDKQEKIYRTYKRFA